MASKGDGGMNLLCHECDAEYPDPSGLDARITGGDVCVSCPGCKRDLAIFAITEEESSSLSEILARQNCNPARGWFSQVEAGP